MPSFKNKRAFYKCVDTLPRGPGWSCEQFELVGDVKDEHGQFRTETLQLWKRDPVDCIKELVGNPAFKNKMKFAPERVYEDKGKTCVYSETWTADWWWEVQVRVNIELILERH